MVSCLCLTAFGFRLPLVKLIHWMRFFLFYFLYFFNGCLDSLVLSCKVVSFSHVWSLALIGCDLWSSNSQIECEAIVVLSCLFFVYIYKDYNLLTISFGTLCFMHLESEHNLNIFFSEFFLMGWPAKKIGSSHRLTRFCFGSKKSDSGHLFFGSGHVKKFWLVLPCLKTIINYKENYHT